MSDPQTISSTSQNFLDIHDITNDIVILKNGSSAVILTVNAMNFGLLAEQEQDSVIYAYAGLLNSINYPIQILIQSQTKDASTYLKLLAKREQETKDKLKQAWIRRYSKFVSDLIRERNVLDKKFFVVIPASSLEMGLTPGQDIISGFKEQTIEGVEKSIILEKAKNLLDPKRDHLIAQFNRIGLYARQLSTEEIIRLFYTNYNPEASEGQKITNSESYTTALVQAQIRGNFMNDQAQNPASASTPASTTTTASATEASAQANPASNEVTPPSTIEPAAPNPSATAPVFPATTTPTPTAVTPQQQIEEVNTGVVNNDGGVNSADISESPTLQQPAVAPAPTPAVTPMSTPAVTPAPTSTPTPGEMTPNVTIEPVAPMPTPTPVSAPTATSTSPSAPTPASTSAPASVPTPAPTPTPTPASTSTPSAHNTAEATADVDNTQKNINETINQMTETPTS